MPPQPILRTGSSGKAEVSQNVSPLAKEFPDWDLMPPAILVRRKAASAVAAASPPPTTAPQGPPQLSPQGTNQPPKFEPSAKPATGVWVCSKCGEKQEEQFDACWKCQAPRP
jgi:hypothetical protein